MRTYKNLLGAAALGIGVAAFGFGAPQEASAGIITLSNASSDSTSASVLDARFQFEVTGSTLELTVFNDTTAPNAYKINELFWNSNDNITSLTPAPAVSGWTYSTTESIGQFGNFKHALLDGVGQDPAQIDAGSSQTFSFTIASAQTATQADFLNTLSTNPPGSTPAFAAAKFVQGPGDDSAFGAAVVPVPAALPLLLTALGALGIIGRKKMKATA